MSQAVGINFKSAVPPRKKKRDRKITVALWVIALVPAVYFYCRYIENLTNVRHPVKGGQTASAASSPKRTLRSLPADNKTPSAITDSPAPASPAPVGFIESLMSAFVPSAEAITLRSDIKPARLAAKPLPVQTGSSGFQPPPLTEEQKRWKVAEDGFGEAMNLAFRYPDHYGFAPDENLRSVRLGDPIPVYQVLQTGRSHYTGQPVTSLLKPADEWIYPIILDNHIRFMVQVRYDGRKYVLGHGSRGLAMIYDKILERWPASEGYHPQLVINPNMPFYYFTVPELSEPNLTDTSRMLEFNPSLTPAAVILESWR